MLFSPRLVDGYVVVEPFRQSPAYTWFLCVMAKLFDSRRISPRRPPAASSVLQRALAQSHLTAKLDRYALFPLWDELAGPEIAAVARPEKILRGKVLVLRVIDDAWVQELTMQKQSLLDRLNQAGVGALLQDIRIVAAGPKLNQNQVSQKKGR